MREIAGRLAEIPGVVAVTLGGSRATGKALPDSDWDFGLYYDDHIDKADVEALGLPGEVFGIGDWGRIVNGGAWLTVDGVKVDLIYRHIPEVLRWSAAADRGEFQVEREVGYVAGIPTYVLAGELALAEVLVGELPRPVFSSMLREAAPRFWFHIGRGALRSAEVHARRQDPTACLANVTQAILCGAHGVLTSRGEWALNEKRLVHRAGLDNAAALLSTTDLPELVRAVAGAIDEAFSATAGSSDPHT